MRTRRFIAITIAFTLWTTPVIAQWLVPPRLSYAPALGSAVARAFAVAQGPLIDAANLLVRTDASGYLLVVSQDYTAPDGPLRTLANTLVRTDANGYLIITNPTGFGDLSARYWVGAASSSLTNEHNLGALSTGLVLNTAGTPSAYGGTTACGSGQAITALSASGVATCGATVDHASVMSRLSLGF